MYVQRVTENASCPPNDNPEKTRHLLQCVSDLSIGLVTVHDALNILSGTLMCSQTTHDHSHGTPVPVIRDPSNSKHQQECHPMFKLSPDIDTAKIISTDPLKQFWRLPVTKIHFAILFSQAMTQ